MKIQSCIDHNKHGVTSDIRPDCLTKVHNLTAPEAFWLWGIHYWMECRVKEVDSIPMFSRAFSEVSITRHSQDDLAPQFDYSLSLLIDFSTKPLSVGCHCFCGLLGNIEQIILSCMALQQSNHKSKKVIDIILKSLLPELVANTVREILNNISQACLKNGMVLPVRPHYLDLAQSLRIPTVYITNDDKTVN